MFFPPDLAGDLFHIPEDPEEVAAPYFADVVFGIAPGQQFTGDGWKLADIVASFQAATAVKITANAHMADPGQPDHMIDMIDLIGHGGQIFGLFLP